MTNQNLIAAICAAYTVDELAALAEDVGADDNETLTLIEDGRGLLKELAAACLRQASVRRWCAASRGQAAALGAVDTSQRSLSVLGRAPQRPIRAASV